MLGEWSGASVDPGEGKPDPGVWTPVAVPGRSSALSEADAAAYRVEFDDPRDDGDERALLVLRGLYAHARVWLNDELVGEHDAYFVPFRHAFEPDPTNELVVECRVPEDRFGGIHDTPVSADAAPGIWWGADVETHPETFFSALSAHPRRTDDGAEIDVEAVVEAGTDLDDRITFSLRPEGEFQSRGMMDRASVEAAAGETVIVDHTIDIHDPELWWPRGMGPQHRYTVRAKLGDETRSVTTGICSVTCDADGLSVNGERVPVRGVNVLSATPDDVSRAVDANATLARMHAHVPPREVYEACDEAGVLVWQDLPLTGPGTFDVERGRTVARNLARARHAHPSLAAFSVHDDPATPFEDGLGTGVIDRLRLRWRAWRAGYDRTDAEAVADALPTDRPVFPVVGPLGVGGDATTLYPGWDYGEAADIGGLLDRYDPAVVAEFGAGALGALDPGEVPGFDRAKHDAHVDGGTDASQRYQARVLKRVAETLRRRDVAVPVAFALRDIGAAGFGVFERDGTEKTSANALAQSYEPVQATLVTPEAGANSAIVAVNDTDEAVACRVEWTAGETNGGATAEVAPHSTEPVESVAVPADADRASLSLSVGDRTVENRYYL